MSAAKFLLACWALTAAPVGLAQSAELAPQAAPREAAWSLHAQLTYQVQGHGGFDAPYEGDNSFQNRKETRASYTTTFFAGRRLWTGAELHLNVELIAGQGLSRVLGLAAPPNGETYRVDSTELKVGLARLFFRQTLDLGERTESVEDAPNQIAGRQSRRRLVFTAGKLSGTDVFDANTYAHDPRTQFNNWALWANAAWDYPADTRGYTYGLVLEAYRDEWSARLGTFLEPREANGIEFDHDVSRAHGEALEVQREHTVARQRGVLRVLAFLNHARMGVYRDAIARDPGAPHVTTTRAPGRAKVGIGLNVEQALTQDVGVFLRVGWNDGKTEAWAFTEIDRTLAFGVSTSGRWWGRARDRFGVGFAVDGINGDHRDYLARGGYGFMLGDGRLSYAAERVLDFFYSFAPVELGSVSIEIQRFENPAFNRDRGPITVLGARLHLEL